MLVDSHCHIDYLENVATKLQCARECGVEHVLCAGVRLDAFENMWQIIQPFDMVSCTVGEHPSEHCGETFDKVLCLRYAQLPGVVGIGETGLDYFHCGGDVSWQQQRFREHIRIARQVGKPLVIHMRDATVDTLRIMREERADEVGGVMHCFTEDWEVAQRAMDLNFHISFSGIVTFKKALQVQQVAQQLPLERMLVETDAPYLAPVPVRSKCNEPAYVRYVAEYIATLRQTTLDSIAQQTTQNFYRLFRA